MSKVLVTDDYLSDIAAAIRENNGESTLYKPAAMGPAIRALASGSASTSSKWVRPDGWEDLDAIAAAGGDDFSGLYATYLVSNNSYVSVDNIISISGATKVEEIMLVDGEINVVQEMDVTIDDSGVCTCDISGLTHGYHTFRITAESYSFANINGIVGTQADQLCAEYYAKNAACTFDSQPYTTSLQRLVFDGVTMPNTCSSMFLGATSLCEFIAISTSGAIESMDYMFYNCYSLASVDLSGLDTSSVTSMSYMFYNCYSLASIDLSGLDTTGVTSMSYIFYNCYSLASVDLSGLDTSSVTSMSYMFYNCYSLASIDLSGAVIPYNYGDASNVFDGCFSLRDLGLSETDMGGLLMHVDISDSPLMTVDSLEALIEELPWVAEFLYLTLAVGTSNLAKLSPEILIEASQKNWDVSEAISE